jgi:hypothetical protein
MTDKKGNLNLLEAIELRNEYDRHIGLIKKLLSVKSYHTIDEDQYYGRSAPKSYDVENKPAEGFDPKEMNMKLKKLETKRLKLNMAIQSTNFASTIEFNGEQISLAEALEIRKKLQKEFDDKTKSVTDSAHKQIIHKEKRDIEHHNRDSFGETYKDFQNSLTVLRRLTNEIHLKNHMSVTNFKDE